MFTYKTLASPRVLVFHTAPFLCFAGCVINNNLWAEVVTPDIPAVNGHVHIINRLLYIPYHSVSHLLNNMEELR